MRVKLTNIKVTNVQGDVEKGLNFDSRAPGDSEKPTEFEFGFTIETLGDV